MESYIHIVKNRRPYNLYCVGGDVKPCSINKTYIHSMLSVGLHVLTHAVVYGHWTQATVLDGHGGASVTSSQPTDRAHLRSV